MKEECFRRLEISKNKMEVKDEGHQFEKQQRLVSESLVWEFCSALISWHFRNGAVSADETRLLMNNHRLCEAAHEKQTRLAVP